MEVQFYIVLVAYNDGTRNFKIFHHLNQAKMWADIWNQRGEYVQIWELGNNVNY